MNPELIEREIALDPLRLARRLARRPGTVLLSAQRPWHGARGSVLLFDPAACVRSELGPTGRRLSSDGLGPLRPGRPPWILLEDLRQRFGRSESKRGSAPQPLIAGWIGYDEGAFEADALHPTPPPFAVPDSWLGVYDRGVRFGDGHPPRLFVRDLGGGRDRAHLRNRFEELREVLANEELGSSSVSRAEPVRPSSLDPAWHAHAVDVIRDHLRRGECYQVNLTGQMSGATACAPIDHFLRHGEDNPVPFAAYLHSGEATVTSHSPERLLRLDGRVAETTPIKGTAIAGAEARAALRASEKDRAEHVMIVDLCRNDLAARAVPGTVEVVELMQPLSIRGIEHLISRIRARIRPGRRAGLFGTLFPGASITGAPKLRAMQLIRELELHRRGPYTGAIGYVEPNGDADWNIAIRTAVWQDGRVHFGCGGGVVLDSDATSEYEEAILKARSFFDSFRSLGSRDSE